MKVKIKNFLGYGDEFKNKSIEEIYKASKEIVSNLPNFEKKNEDMIKCRGTILELSINLESIFNEVILLTNHPERVYDKSFEKKGAYIIQVLNRIDLKNKIDKKEFIKKIKRITRIRHLYAHVPQDLLNDELVFESKEIYSKWSKEINGKTVKDLNNEFLSTYKEILSQNKILIGLLKEDLDSKLSSGL